MTDAALARADANLDAAVHRLFEFLRIPSISTDSAYDGECRRAAEWAAKELSAIGFDAAVHPTNGHPMVVGQRKSGTAGAKRVLFYGHYDVQPPDPLALWTSPPFEPVIAQGARGRVIAARGSSDDKGQVMTFIEACRALIETSGSLPLDVTVFLEGEEESHGNAMEPFLKANRELLAADLVLVCDTGLWDPQTPAITTMLRGICYEEVILHAAKMDLHSGMYGGAAQNPINVLSRVIAGLHDDKGRVTLPGFYDGVVELSDDVKRDWAALNFSGADFLGAVGLSVPSGEKDRAVLEQITVRPTCDVNGITGGYTGEGAKTVIAATASAKISFRLVGKQDPEAVRTAFRSYVKGAIPADCRVEFINHGGSPAVVVPSDSAAVKAAQSALEQEWGRRAPVIGTGGSIPVVGQFKAILGLDSLLIGWANDDDAVHSPNEKYDLASFHKGTRSWIRVLEALAKA